MCYGVLLLNNQSIWVYLGIWVSNFNPAELSTEIDALTMKSRHKNRCAKSVLGRAIEGLPGLVNIQKAMENGHL